MMTDQAESLLKEMDDLLDRLVDNAEKLNKLSLQVIAEEELLSLQADQQEMLSELLRLDDAYHTANPNASKGRSTPTQKSVTEKLGTFQRLNASFVDHITNARGLIQFEGKKKSLKK